jgi:hypothetical protein
MGYFFNPHKTFGPFCHLCPRIRKDPCTKSHFCFWSFCRSCQFAN